MHNNNKIRIAYIAPEIPALSATFVYQEILQLKELSINVFPISIHRPHNKAQSESLRQLSENTLYLYDQSLLYISALNIKLLFSSPISYLRVFKMAFQDSRQVGLMSHVGKGLLYRFFMAGGLVDFLQKNKITHIHSNFAHIPTDIAMYAAALNGNSFSFNSHANDLFERGWLLKQKIDRSRFAVTISEYNKKFLESNGADSKKISVVHCGVNTGSFSHRGKHNSHEPPLLGSLGRMVEKKGFDILISACSILKKGGVSFRLQIAGGGPLKNELKRLAVTLGVSDNIEFIDSISHENVPSWIKSLDVFVLPCKKDKQGDMDGIPVVLMEAMLSGVPVITSHISGIPELVIDGITGLLCNGNKPQCFADKIKIMIANEELKENLCNSAMTKVKTDFELKANVERLAGMLSK